MKTCICVRANILRDGARDYCSVRGYVYAPPQSIGILCECEYACLCIRERFVLVHVFVSHFVVRLCVCACVVRSFVNVYVLIFCMFRTACACVCLVSVWPLCSTATLISMKSGGSSNIQIILSLYPSLFPSLSVSPPVSHFLPVPSPSLTIHGLRH